MSAKTRTELKALFQTGNKITQEKLHDFLDSFLHSDEDESEVKSNVGLAPSESAIPADEQGKLPPERMPDEIDVRLSVLGGSRSALLAANLSENELSVDTDEGSVVYGDGAGNVRATKARVDAEVSRTQMAAYTLGMSKIEWRKAVKFTSTRVTAMSGTVLSSTGYARIINFDGTQESVVGSGSPTSNITITAKAPTAPFDTPIPKFYAVYPCDASGDISGDVTRFSFNNRQITSIDVAGLGALDQLSVNSNQLTSLDITGLVALTNLGLNDNHISSIDLFENKNIAYLFLSNNHIKHISVKGLPLLELQLDGNLLTSLDLSGTVFEDGSGYEHAILSNNNMSGSSLDALYQTLPTITSGATLNVSGNPGVGSDDPNLVPSNWNLVGS